MVLPDSAISVMFFECVFGCTVYTHTYVNMFPRVDPGHFLKRRLTAWRHLVKGENIVTTNKMGDEVARNLCMCYQNCHTNSNAIITSLASVGDFFLFPSEEPTACQLCYDIKKSASRSVKLNNSRLLSRIVTL